MLYKYFILLSQAFLREIKNPASSTLKVMPNIKLNKEFPDGSSQLPIRFNLVN